MTIKVYEKSQRAKTVEHLLAEHLSPLGIESLYILPIPSTRDGVSLNGSDMTLYDSVAGAGAGSLVIGYGIPDSIKEMLLVRGALLVDSSLDEEFLVENAELTALATLGIILNTDIRAPKDLTVGIVGYGRIGKSLVHHLAYLGATLIVFTSREEVRETLSGYGVMTARSGDGGALSSLDILINTAPAKIFDTGEESVIPTSLRVIDLASGVNFPSLASVERYPSLPARMFPSSAGRVWFDSVMRNIGEG